MAATTRQKVPPLTQAVPGKDAVCFTAGYHGASFAAGVIHAYLAADRDPPAVVAGISLGAVNAAAFQKCYQELNASNGSDERVRESRRWHWYRKYLHELTGRPLQSVWESLPSLPDFFSDRYPIEDLATPDELRSSAREAMERRHKLVKTCQWLARSPIKVKSLAGLATAYVRLKEDEYPEPWVVRIVGFAFRSFWIGLLLLAHVACHPMFVRTLFAHRKGEARWKAGLRKWFAFLYRRPLLGWVRLFTAWGVVFGPTAVAFTALFDPFARALRMTPWLGWSRWIWILLSLSGTIGLVLGWIVRLGWLARRIFARGGWKDLRCLGNHGIQDGLAVDHYLRLKLHDLFGDATVHLRDKDGAPRLAIVVASLQNGSKNSDSKPAEEPAWKENLQRWIPHGQKLVDGLCAAIAMPPLLPPCEVGGASYIDGATVRQNPLPALIGFLHTEKELAYDMTVEKGHGGPRARHARSIHVIYNVPVTPRTTDGGRYPEDKANIVDVAFHALKLARRRDTQLEVEQTQVVSKLIRLVWEAGGVPPNARKADFFPLFADEIAPPEDPQRPDAVPSPDSKARLLKNTADGCRRTLETLYSDTLSELARQPGARPREVRCAQLLGELAGRRRPFIEKHPDSPGLPEVCKHCKKVLEALPSAESEIPVKPSLSAEHLPASMRSSKNEWGSGRIVFTLSGGVFRGTFHVGMAAGLCASRAQVDIIAGASVGTLLGGAMAGLLKYDGDAPNLTKLRELVAVFSKVDQRVALTRRIKSAFRDLGVRGRGIALSLSRIRKEVLRGSRAEPGYAATGAPPVLIDAISELFMIPHQQTKEIAAEFVAGHVARAVKLFWEQIKTDGLRRLGIEQELMGTALLEKVAKELLAGPGADPGAANPRQPYMNDRDKGRIAFFATTSDLGAEKVLILGTETDELLAGCPYDFVEGALASSAFPAVFMPRRQSQLFPGWGDPQIRYADGGIFDNLPIQPLIEVLQVLQCNYRKQKKSLRPSEFLEQRLKAPDLFLVGSLEASPEQGIDGEPRNLVSMWRHARSLGYNVKIKSLENTSEVVHELMSQLGSADLSKLSDREQERLDRFVHAAVLPVFPADEAHLNGTFAFCKSLGLEKKTVYRSMGDGCFQTLAALAGGSQKTHGDAARSPSFADEALKKLRAFGKVWHVRRVSSRRSAPEGTCPFFACGAHASDAQEGRLSCPFYAARDGTSESAETDRALFDIYRECRKDPAHTQTSSAPA